jgi:hypothetical protein
MRCIKHTSGLNEIAAEPSDASKPVPNTCVAQCAQGCYWTTAWRSIRSVLSPRCVINLPTAISHLCTVNKADIKHIVSKGIADFLIPIKYSVYTTQKGEFRSTNRQVPFKIYLYYILIPCSSYLHYMGAAKIGEVLSEC